MLLSCDPVPRCCVTTPPRPLSPYLAKYPVTVAQTTGDSMTEAIKPLFSQKVVHEDDDVTLSCSYKDFSGRVDNLYWYRQYPKSKPEFLLYIFQVELKVIPSHCVCLLKLMMIIKNK
ncbi:hypothetical protein AMELA_G00070350 [Ameiurus melas]|uniref:Immunoglobulin V-set domain-containing protein n=1 Tax=Ameiurus melas TaxID=219545 RepID=A0A7J6B6K3_AMEME|nr:hypothetical protein AMELA_G00070350 [Ameiurus melas]